MRRVLFSALTIFFAFTALEARAELYKFKKPDGTVVYTDNLAQLPAEKREYYNRQKQEREQKRAELEKQIGKEELERREAETTRAALAQQEMAETERAERTRAIDTVLKEIQQKRAQREAARDVWKQKMRQAREQLDKKLQEHAIASERANSIGMQADFSRLPGQNEELENLKKDLERLENEIDALALQVDETIPEQARKEGVPPGWLR